MKYFKKFLFIVLFALCWVCFCSADSYTFTKCDTNNCIYHYTPWEIEFTWNFILNPAYITNYECPEEYCAINFTNTQTYDVCQITYYWYFWYSDCNDVVLNWNYMLDHSDMDSFDTITFTIPNNSCDYSWYILESNINTAYCTWHNLCPVCDYSSYVSQINSLSWSLYNCNASLTISNNTLAGCQSDLTACQNSSSSAWTWSCSVNWKISENILFTWSKSATAWSYSNVFNYGNNGAWTYCVKLTSSSPQQLTMWFANGWTSTPSNLYTLYSDQYSNWICLYGNKAYFNIKPNSNLDYSFEVYKLTDLLNSSIPCTTPSCDYSWYVLESNVTQNYCTNKYQNLIPESDITSDYCEVEFWLIDPVNCPSGWSWTGDVQRSALYINNVQYLGSPNIYVNVNDILDYSMTYVSWSAIIDVDGYKADTWYMADILTVQEYHPSSEDFTVAFVSFLTLWLPYVVVILFVVFVRKLIRKIFKS